jgi:hypothetical protein
MMKMKKYIGAIIIALTTATMLSSCTKEVDVQAVSALLPGLQLSSVGMLTQGPYALPTSGTSTLQIVFGATTTNKSTGAFDVVITDVSVTPNVTAQTLHFNSWTSNDTFNATSGGSISFTTVPSSYPNTTIYQGSILVKYSATAPFITGHQYTVKATASTNDATPVTSAVTVAKLFAIQ